MARILVIGGSGFVGANLVKRFGHEGMDIAFTYASSPIELYAQPYHVDMSQNWDSLRYCINDFRPTTVIHCATPSINDDNAQQRLNVDSIREITPLIDDSALFIYFSTNAVFNDGGPHDESSHPQSRTDKFKVYGETRAAGESLALETHPNTLVIRTDTVNGRNFQGILNRRLLSLVNSLEQEQPLTRFNDRYITPTLVDNLVDATYEICTTDFDFRGILHIAGSERLTDFEYTRKLTKYLKVDEGLVQPERMADHPTLSTIPHDNSLDTSKAQQLLTIPLLKVNEQFERLFT